MQSAVHGIRQRLACFRAVVRLQTRPALERPADPADRADSGECWLGKGLEHFGRVHTSELLGHLERLDGDGCPLLEWELHEVSAKVKVAQQVTSCAARVNAHIALLAFFEVSDRPTRRAHFVAGRAPVEIQMSVVVDVDRRRVVEQAGKVTYEYTGNFNVRCVDRKAMIAQLIQAHVNISIQHHTSTLLLRHALRCQFQYPLFVDLVWDHCALALIVFYANV